MQCDGYLPAIQVLKFSSAFTPFNPKDTGSFTQLKIPVAICSKNNLGSEAAITIVLLLVSNAHLSKGGFLIEVFVDPRLKFTGLVIA